MTDYLAGKNIAITGAGSGIGREIALAAASEGANIVVADYGVALDGSEPTNEIANSVVAEIKNLGVEAEAVTGDVSQMQTGHEVVETAVKKWGSIDGVVCVAGILRERMLFNMDESEWDAVIAVHLKGHFTIYRHAMAAMRNIVQYAAEFLSDSAKKVSGIPPVYIDLRKNRVGTPRCSCDGTSAARTIDSPRAIYVFGVATETGTHPIGATTAKT